MDAAILPRFSLPTAVSQALLRPVRSRQTHFALAAAAMIVARNFSPLNDVLQELGNLHEHMKNRGFQDLTTSVLVTGMTELNRASEAVAILDAYLRRDRRERVTLPPSLLRIARRLGVSVSEGLSPRLNSDA
jgi:hypothetical protein